MDNIYTETDYLDLDDFDSEDYGFGPRTDAELKLDYQADKAADDAHHAEMVAAQIHDHAHSAQGDCLVSGDDADQAHIVANLEGTGFQPHALHPYELEALEMLEDTNYYGEDK